MPCSRRGGCAIPACLAAGGVPGPGEWGLLPGGVPGLGGESAPGGVPGRGGLLLGGAWSGGVCSEGCLVETSLDGYCCGRYASYWNAFLFQHLLVLASLQCNKTNQVVIQWT